MSCSLSHIRLVLFGLKNSSYIVAFADGDMEDPPRRPPEVIEVEVPEDLSLPSPQVSNSGVRDS